MSSPWRNDFPLLKKDLVYLDTAATSLKPQVVINDIVDYYQSYSANIHRGVYEISQRATNHYEACRKTIKDFLYADENWEVVFTSGTTEAINLVAHSLGELLEEGDEIILTEMEHHSNLVPWQILAERKKLILKFIPLKNDGSLASEKLESLITSRTKIFSCVHLSNTLGVINPVKELVATAKKHNIWTLLDGAQALPHLDINLQEIDCDFYVFSGHKFFGPTGVGALCGKRKLLEIMPPYQGGGDMIERVDLHQSSFAPVPAKFEAGTPNIAQVIGMKSAFEYFSGLNKKSIYAYEMELFKEMKKQLGEIEEIKLYSPEENVCSAISFTVEGIHPHDLGSFCDQDGICVRVGHHCTQPIMKFFNIPATVRASLSFYNDRNDLKKLTESLKKTITFFK